MFFRANQGTPLTGAQVDANNRELLGLAQSPLYLTVHGPEGTAVPYKYSNAIGNLATPSTFYLSALNTLRMWPFVPSFTFSATKLTYYVTSTSTTNTFRLGFYSPDALGFPKNLMWNSGANSVYYAGSDFATLNLTFEAGKVYWLAVTTEAAGGYLRACQSSLGILRWEVTSNADRSLFGVKFPSVGYGAFPNTVTFTDWATNGETAGLMPAFMLE